MEVIVLLENLINLKYVVDHFLIMCRLVFLIIGSREKIKSDRKTSIKLTRKTLQLPKL